MATCRDLITRAMREIRAIGSGEDPTADELTDGLTTLQSLVDGLYGNSVGYTLTDVEIDGDTDLEADTRYLVFAESEISVTLPESPKNGARLQIHDVLGTFSTYPFTIEATPSDIVLGTPGVYTFIYLADTATWTRVSPLTADSLIPLGEDEVFSLELAQALAPMFGASLTVESQNRLMRARARLRARLEVSRDNNGAEYF